MSLNVTFNGVVYIIPETGEVGWGGNTTSYLIAIAAGALQKTGGSFLLSAETDFGGSFGLKSIYYKSRSSNIASTGILRLSNSDSMDWRNFANNGDLSLSVDTSDQLLYNGSIVLTGSTPSAYVSSVTGTANQVIASAATGAVTLSLPQSLATNSTLQLGKLGLGSSVETSAILSAVSTTLGFLMPRMTTVQRDAIISPAEGLQVYNTDTDQFNYYNGVAWATISTGGGSGVVSSGLQYQLAYYPSNGTTVTGLTLITASRALISDSNGLPIASTVTPTELQGLHLLTASRAIVTDGSGILSPSTVTSTELGYLAGVTGSIQTQLGTKLDLSGGTMSGDIDMAGNSIISPVINSINATFIGMGRNRMFNGEMRLDQRNVGAALTVGSLTMAYTLDRWVTNNSTNGDVTVQQSTVSPLDDFPDFLRVACTVADNALAVFAHVIVSQNIEGNNIVDFSFGTTSVKNITVSFWVRSSLTGIYAVSFRNASLGETYVLPYTINSADTWEYKTLVFVNTNQGAWLTDSGIGLNVSWALAAGTNAQGVTGSWQNANYVASTSQVNFMSSNTARTWDLTGVQIELGSTATAYEYKPIPYELASCQRYYEKSYSLATALGTATNNGSVRGARLNGGYGTTTTFLVRKRAAPTVVSYSPTTGTSGKLRNFNSAADENATAENIGDHGFGVAGSAAITSDLLGYHFTADAEL